MPKTKAPKVHHLVTPCIHKFQSSALKKQCTEENEEEAVGCAKFLTKRMKGVKEKHQELWSRDVDCSH